MGFLPRPINLLNKAVGFDGVKISRGIPYGGHARQILDVYAPARGRGQRPVIVFFSGGAGDGAGRSRECRDYAFLAARLVACGFVVVVPEYRVYPKTRDPGVVEDSVRATEWVMGHVGVLGGDAEAVFLMGHAAGAYHAVMLALGPQVLAVAGVIGLAGPYDFEQGQDLADARLHETQPVGRAHGDAAPMLLATGARDRRVPPRHTTALAERVRQAGGVVETRIYPKLGHLGLLLAMLPYFAWRAPVWRDVLAFIEDCRTGVLVRPHSEISTSVIRRSL